MTNVALLRFEKVPSPLLHRVAMPSSASKVFRVAELCNEILDEIKSPRDLLSCICLSRACYHVVIRRLYEGALTNPRFRTPDTSALDFLLQSSRERFAEYLAQTDHLLLFPGVVSKQLNESTMRNRLVWVEPSQVLLDRNDAELLFRPHGRRLKSLAIPIELLRSDLSNIKDLVISPSLQSLCIEYAYCEVLTSKQHSDQNLVKSPLPALSALTIYFSREDYNMAHLCNLIELLDLKVLNLQRILHTRRRYLVQEENYIRLLRSLSGHKNLQALALNNCEIAGYGFHGYEDMGLSQEHVVWPKLKALYVEGISKHISAKLPYRRNLQILSINSFNPGDMIPFGKLGQLKVVDYVSQRFEESHIVSRIATKCRLLRYLRVSLCSHDRELPLSPEGFIITVNSLPYLEVLSLDHSLWIERPELSALAESCPRLKYLELFRAKIDVTYAALVQLNPLKDLEVFKCQNLYFHFHKNDTDARAQPVQNFAKLWQQKFPSLRYAICRGDKDISQRHRNLEEQYELRRKVFKLLKYSDNENITERIRFKWLNEYEVSLFDWPIIPFLMYLDPKRVPEYTKGALGPASVMKQRIETERGVFHVTM